jgi:hypothetical protein
MSANYSDGSGFFLIPFSNYSSFSYSFEIYFDILIGSTFGLDCCKASRLLLIGFMNISLYWRKSLSYLNKLFKLPFQRFWLKLKTLPFLFYFKSFLLHLYLAWRYRIFYLLDFSCLHVSLNRWMILKMIQFRMLAI